MKSAVQLIVLLACIFLCASGHPIKKCRCIKTIPAVKRDRLADVNVYEPNPICSKRQVIAVLKDNSQRCLDPKSDFTKRLLRDKEMNKKKLSTTTTTTTTTTTAAATTQSAATSSVTNQRR